MTRLKDWELWGFEYKGSSNGTAHFLITFARQNSKGAWVTRAMNFNVIRSRVPNIHKAIKAFADSERAAVNALPL